MSKAGFDTLTDWIGIPISIVLLVLLVLVDSRFIAERMPARRLVVGLAVVTVAALAINIARFARLA